MVSTGFVVHRRCGACDVTCRRSRHQPGNSGCSCNGQHTRATLVAGLRFVKPLAKGAVAPRVSDEGDAVGTSTGAGENSEAGAREPTKSSGAVVLKAVQKRSGVKTDTGAVDWSWCQTRTCEDT